jgi:hypothetical protein
MSPAPTAEPKRRRTSVSVGVRKTAQRVRFTVRLRGVAGRPAVVRLRLARATPSGWRVLRSRVVTVDTEGRDRLSLRRPARGRCRVRVVFPGTNTLRPSRAGERFRC